MPQFPALYRKYGAFSIKFMLVIEPSAIFVALNNPYCAFCSPVEREIKDDRDFHGGILLDRPGVRNYRIEAGSLPVAKAIKMRPLKIRKQNRAVGDARKHLPFANIMLSQFRVRRAA